MKVSLCLILAILATGTVGCWEKEKRLDDYGGRVYQQPAAEDPIEDRPAACDSQLKQCLDSGKSTQECGFARLKCLNKN